MGCNYRSVDFDEDHEGGQRLIEVYNRTADYVHIVYIDADGKAHEVLSGTDPMVSALLKLLENRRHETREATKEEREIAHKVVFI